MTPLAYALVTPARDEVENVRRLAEAVRAQTVRPEAWIIVDNGSTDGTESLARDLADEEPWIDVVTLSADGNPRPGAPVVRAFHAGLRRLGRLPDVVVKLDADVSFPPDYFERLLAAFALDPKLGIASGVCYERSAGVWHPTHVTGSHVRGAARAYRRSCLEQVLPLEERMGWDGVDELKAASRGWTTRVLPELVFYHHRSVGERDGARHSRWVAQGRGAHYMGYRFPYLIARTLFRARRDPAALAMLWGYAAAAAKREPRCPDTAARAYLRREQRLRNLGRRRQEALGRRTS